MPSVFHKTLATYLELKAGTDFVGDNIDAQTPFSEGTPTVQTLSGPTGMAKILELDFVKQQVLPFSPPTAPPRPSIPHSPHQLPAVGTTAARHPLARHPQMHMRVLHLQPMMAALASSLVGRLERGGPCITGGLNPAGRLLP